MLVLRPHRGQYVVMVRPLEPAQAWLLETHPISISVCTAFPRLSSESLAGKFLQEGLKRRCKPLATVQVGVLRSWWESTQTGWVLMTLLVLPLAP